MTIDPILSGGCLCEGVRFTYAGPLGGEKGAVTVCHCGQCRKAQGYAAAVAPILASELTIERGEGQIRTFESSPGKIRAFCGTCGSPLWSKLAAKPDRMRLRLGTLDNPPDDLRIEAHTHTGGEPAWSRENTAPRYPAQEPGRQ